ncbi:SIS domain-containing protein [Candidatus Pelagibacter sp.]|nr:SIS domain-containing protein [Candidatus Pelagibacter sp.]|tara:strand:- start:171 stop:731 length:561 start_codon:yes stop_codon:yes gene_type:complete
MINFKNYKKNLIHTLNQKDLDKDTKILFNEIKKTWKMNKNFFICGNGGSGANAIHIANDFLYGAGISNKRGLKVESLTSNPAVLTCLANDIGYEKIFSEQIKVKGEKNDFLLVLSGSGNSKNIINALKEAKKLKLRTFAIVGFSGGKCIKLADNYIHTKINDMQISEDFQMILLNIIMKELSRIKL